MRYFIVAACVFHVTIWHGNKTNETEKAQAYIVSFFFSSFLGLFYVVFSISINYDE